MTVMLWDMRANGRAPIQTLKEAQDSVTAVKMTANAIVTASVDGAVRIYDLRSGKQHTDWLPGKAFGRGRTYGVLTFYRSGSDALGCDRGR